MALVAEHLVAPQVARKGRQRPLPARKPGGKFAAMVWPTAERHPIVAQPLGIIEARGLLPSPLPGQPRSGPFVLDTPDALAAVFQQAGFHEVPLEPVALRWRFPSVAATLDYLRLNVTALDPDTSSVGQLIDTRRNFA